MDLINFSYDTAKKCELYGYIYTKLAKLDVVTLSCKPIVIVFLVIHESFLNIN